MADAYAAYVKSLLRFQGSISDEVPHTWTTSGDAALSTEQYLDAGESFKPGSGYITSTSGDYVSAPLEPWAIELWFYDSGTANSSPCVFSADWKIFLGYGMAGFTLNADDGIAYGATFATGWHHLAVSHDSGTVKMYLDGATYQTIDITWHVEANQRLAGNQISIGRHHYDGGAELPTGIYIDEFRLTIGHQRYASTFSPPYPPFPYEPEGFASVVLSVTITGASFPFGKPSLPLSVNVIPASIISGASSVCMGAGVAAVWAPVVLIGGVDYSNLIVGEISVEAEEGAARLADLSLKPTAGTSILLPAWTGKQVVIDVADMTTGSPRYPMRLFTGIVDTPAIDLDSKTIQLRCTDDLQSIVEAMSKTALDALIAGYYSAAIFNASSGSWSYANDLLSTVPKSLDISPSGLLRCTAWQAKSTADIAFDANVIGAGSLAVDIVDRGSLINRVDVSFDYRFPRVKAESYSVSYQYVDETSINAYVAAGNWFLQREAVKSAISSAGGTILYISWVPLPSSAIGSWVPGPYDATLCMGFTASVTFDYVQETEEGHRIAVLNQASVDAVGLRAKEISGALQGKYPEPEAVETTILLYKQEISSIPPTDTAPPLAGKTNSANVTLSPETNRAAADKAMESLIQTGKVEIFASHRRNSVSAMVPLIPAIDLDKTVSINAGGVVAKGKVRKVAHRMNTDSGEAVSELVLAICAMAGTGVTHPETTTAAPAGTTPGNTTLAGATVIDFQNGPTDAHTFSISFPAVEAAERLKANPILNSTFLAPISEDVFTITV